MTPDQLAALKAASAALADTAARFASSFTATIQTLNQNLTALTAQATALATAVAAVDPPVPTPPPMYIPVQYGRFVYEVDSTPVAAQAARWPVQVLQGDEWHLDQLKGLRALSLPGTLTLRYASMIARTPSDPPGAIQCVPPGQVPDAWMLRNKYGDIITRAGRGGAGFIDPGNPDYQQAAIKFLVATCRAQGWPGVFFDEGCRHPEWSFGDNQATDKAKDLPVKYPGRDAYATALRGFIQAVTPALRAAGLKVWVNLAGEFNATGWDAWTKGVAGDTDGHCIEFFVARGHEPTASVENGYWLPMLDWMRWQSSVPVKAMYHAMTSDETLARYALGTYLLAAPQSMSVFMASQDPYEVGKDVWSADMQTAKLLGGPAGSYKITGGGLYVREFERGTVTVNPSEKVIAGVAKTSAAIALK